MCCRPQPREDRGDQGPQGLSRAWPEETNIKAPASLVMETLGQVEEWASPKGTLKPVRNSG